MTPRHVKVTGTPRLFRYERCGEGCHVGEDGVSSCGNEACPSCGSGGANVTIAAGELQCTCGHAWVRQLAVVAA